MDQIRRLQVIWDLKGDRKKAARLSIKLFGRKLKRNGKVVCYDGLLAAFKDGRRMKRVDFERLGPASVSVPRELKEPIRAILGKLDIDGRAIEYDGRNNFYWKTDVSASSSHDLETNTELGQARQPTS